MAIGKLLRNARSLTETTQGELARLARTSRPTVSAYENDHKDPSAATLQRLLGVLGLRLDVVPLVNWTAYPTSAGHQSWVASHLWRAPTERALARVELPLHLNWSTPGQIFDLGDRNDRGRVYEVMLREGEPEDIETYVDGLLLADIWTDLVLPRRVRSAWQPTIHASARPVLAPRRAVRPLSGPARSLPAPEAL